MGSRVLPPAQADSFAGLSFNGKKNAVYRWLIATVCQLEVRCAAARACAAIETLPEEPQMADLLRHLAADQHGHHVPDCVRTADETQVPVER